METKLRRRDNETTHYIATDAIYVRKKKEIGQQTPPAAIQPSSQNYDAETVRQYTTSKRMQYSSIYTKQEGDWTKKHNQQPSSQQAQPAQLGLLVHPCPTAAAVASLNQPTNAHVTLHQLSYLVLRIPQQQKESVLLAAVIPASTWCKSSHNNSRYFIPKTDV